MLIEAVIPAAVSRFSERPATVSLKSEAQRAELNHRQKRGILTRNYLLRSARTVFARDGFEHARVEDIALKAGKTRGAFYDNFKDKEDVFFAIFEDNLEHDVQKLGPLLSALPTVDQRIDALGEYLSQLGEDRERILLNLEFKLYAIRHPRKRKRLASLHGNMRRHGSIPELNRLLAQLAGEAGDTDPGAGPIGSPMICSIFDGLALNHLFDPDIVDHPELARYLKLCLRETLIADLKQPNTNEAPPNQLNPRCA